MRVTLALLEALQNAPHCNLLFVSSGGTLYGDKTVKPATESSQIAPLSYHGAGKAAAEHFISAWAQQFSRSATILRPSNVYGPGQTAKQGFGIIPNTFAKIKNDEVLEIWGDGNAVRDYLYIDDLVQLCLAILDTQMGYGITTLNAGSNTGTSLNELLSLIEDITGSRIRRVQQTKRQVDASRVVIDSSEAQKLLGWEPRTPLAEGLRQTWNWWTNPAMTVSPAPVCTVCIANYNGESLLVDCIDSVLNQQCDFLVEIIVHDDASTDKSLELLATRYPQVKVIASQAQRRFLHKQQSYGRGSNRPIYSAAEQRCRTRPRCTGNSA